MTTVVSLGHIDFTSHCLFLENEGRRVSGF